MRPLETLLLVANVLAFCVSAVRLPHAVRWARNMPVIIPPMALAQLWVEGARWQMFPAYALSVLFFAGWTIRSIAPKDRFVGRMRVHLLAVLLSVIGLTIAIALPTLIPVFHLPHPSGPYGIGTLTYHWVDENRRDVFSGDLNARRELMVQIWYPAKEDRSSPHAPYVQNPEALASTARLLHLPKFFFAHLKHVASNAIPGAPAADEEPNYPVLIFLSGRGGYRQSNTFQVEELVSHGYIVAAVDQPHASAGVVFPGARLIVMDPRMFDPAHPGHAAFLDEVLPFLAQDISFALNQLASLDQADPNGILTGRLDLLHEGIFGVSLGGIVAAESCLTELRLRACLVMDAFMPADVVRSGLRQPAMWISRDARDMRLEGWAQADIDETQRTMREVFDYLPGDGYLIRVPGAFHANFSDAPLFSPLTRWLGVTGPIDGRRALDAMSAYSLAFFDRHLKGRREAMLEGPSARFPEILFESRAAHKGLTR